jgi:hypothetical protein
MYQKSLGTTDLRFNTGMHNIRLVGQMWPAKPEILFLLLVFFYEILCLCKIWPLNKKNFWPAMGLELCTPDLTGGI